MEKTETFDFMKSSLIDSMSINLQKLHFIKKHNLKRKVKMVTRKMSYTVGSIAKRKAYEGFLSAHLVTLRPLRPNRGLHLSALTRSLNWSLFDRTKRAGAATVNRNNNRETQNERKRPLERSATELRPDSCTVLLVHCKVYCTQCTVFVAFGARLENSYTFKLTSFSNCTKKNSLSNT